MLTGQDAEKPMLLVGKGRLTAGSRCIAPSVAGVLRLELERGETAAGVRPGRARAEWDGLREAIPRGSPWRTDHRPSQWSLQVVSPCRHRGQPETRSSTTSAEPGARDDRGAVFQQQPCGLARNPSTRTVDPSQGELTKLTSATELTGNLVR